MSEDVKLEVIKLTQDSLSKYIKKPPLTEKLLRKPPFRYLHDITTAVMRETGYLQGLFSQDELNAENIKDRDAKIAFLEKLISAVNLSTGVNITARPNKIVAGLDVAKTNELLQAIGKALEKKIDSSEAVDLVLNKKTKGVNASKKEVSKGKPSKDSKVGESKAREPKTSEALKKKNKEKTKPPEKSDSRKVKTKKEVSPTKLSKAPSVKEPSEPAKSKSKALNGVDEDTIVPSEIIINDNHNNSEPKHDVKPPPPSLPVTSGDPSTGLEVNETKNMREEQSNSSITEPEQEIKKVKETGDKGLGKEVKQKLHRSESRKEVRTQNEMRKEEKITSDSKRESRHFVESEKENRLPVDLETEADAMRENKVKPEEELKRPQSARAVHRKKPTRKPVTNEEFVGIENKDEPLSIGLAQSQDKEDLENRPKASVQGEGRRERPRTAARPASARPGAPRVRDRGVTLLPDTDNKVISEPVNLIVDTKDLPDEDDNTLVTVEEPAPTAVMDQVTEDGQLTPGDQGHLVAQILETQKELEDTASTSEALQKVEISWAGGRGREAVAREVEKLRSAIQALTRAANPLGKLIDFLQEDVEAMEAELESWTATNKQLSQDLQAEERLTEESTEPLARQLQDISLLVQEQYEEISVVKAAILRNDERINKLLKSNSSRPG